MSDVEASQACIFAIHSLLSAFIQTTLHRQREEVADLVILAWPARQPDRFISLLNQRQPEALIILAHYCVLLQHSMDDGTWFLIGCARRVLDAIKTAIPESLHSMLVWPESIINQR